MNSKISNTITNKSVQQLPDGSQVSVTFSYPSNFKIGDIITVSSSKEVMQQLEPQHEEGCYGFDVTIWDDEIRLYCDSKKEIKNQDNENTVYSFKIREIELFANRFPVAQKAELYN
jgi:hypothetical protein